MVTSGDRGEKLILARFATCSVGAQMIVIPDGLKYERPSWWRNNYVDTLVNDKLDKLRMFPLRHLQPTRSSYAVLHSTWWGVLPTPMK